MKTSVTMKRKMGNFDILQRTSDGMFNATALLKQWNNSSTTERKLDNYFNSDKTKEFIIECRKTHKSLACGQFTTYIQNGMKRL